ncbi:hypothetical protein AVEN_170953-1 [Araneus ventricosus]|uniref:Uncharacterized protein n=1 Tax=Araneus ventricosus TaxID=182803 RepID=A0A4Y2LQP2_ARAVE|nr:hypothetical protein AVEN_170953-1 [Araneus ventricosus]
MTAPHGKKNLKMKKLKSKSTNGEWRGNNRTRQCFSGSFHGNLSGAFHGNHLRCHRKITFSVELEADNREEKSTLPLPSHYQLFKNRKSTFQVLNEFFIHNMPAQKFYRNVLSDSTTNSNSFRRMLSRQVPVAITRFC